MRQPSIKLIAAISDDDIIGLPNGELPWVLPSDLKHFKELTEDNTVVMGWNTWRSIGERPLPNRKNIVLSRTKRKLPRSKDVHQIYNPLDVLKLPKNWAKGHIWIIGGGEVYKTFLPLVQEMYLTFVHVKIGNGIKFPKVNWSEWRPVSESEIQTENSLDFEIRHYVRYDF